MFTVSTLCVVHSIYIVCCSQYLHCVCMKTILGFCEVRVAQSLVFCVVLCWPLYVQPLYCLFFSGLWVLMMFTVSTLCDVHSIYIMWCSQYLHCVMFTVSTLCNVHSIYIVWCSQYLHPVEWCRYSVKNKLYKNNRLSYIYEHTM
jgi:hypothetical protein